MKCRYVPLLAFLLLLLLPFSARSQSWTQLDTLPMVGSDGLFSFSIGSTVFVGGGEHRDFFAFDTATGVWSKKADIPGVTKERAFPTGFAIGSKGYLAFGFDGSTQPGFIKNDLWQYDPVADKWTRKSDCPGVARDGAGVFVLNGKAYIGGGQDGQQQSLADFYEYDPTADKWTQETDLPGGPLVFPSCFAIGSYGYFACGAVNLSETSHVWRYYPYTNSWTKCASFAGKPRQDAVGFTLGGLGYVGFGEAQFTTPYSDFYSYDPIKDSWTKVADAGDSNARAWATAAVVGNEVFLGTGWDMNLRFFNDWWKLSLPVTPYVATGHLSLNAISLDFGSVKAGKEQDSTLVIHSGNETAVTISAIALTGTGSGAYAIKNKPILPLKLDPGKDLPLTISFIPTSDSEYDATLTITSDAEGESGYATTLPVYGQGVKTATPHVILTTSLLDFGTVAASMHKSGSLVIHADTTAPLTITAFTITGPDSALFALTNPPHVPAMIQPGSSQPVTITFSPQKAGTYTASLTIVSNADGEAAHQSSVALHGVASVSGVSMRANETSTQLASWPNPFSDHLTIQWDADAAMLDMRLVDALGREVMNLGNQRSLSGMHSMIVHTGSLPAGQYWVVSRSLAGVSEQALIKY